MNLGFVILGVIAAFVGIVLWREKREEDERKRWVEQTAVRNRLTEDDVARGYDVARTWATYLLFTATFSFEKHGPGADDLSDKERDGIARRFVMVAAWEAWKDKTPLMECLKKRTESWDKAVSIAKYREEDAREDAELRSRSEAERYGEGVT